MMFASYLQASARKASRIAVVASTLLIAGLATSACGASSDSGGQPNATTTAGVTATPRAAGLPPMPAVPQCPIGWNFCFTGYNNALVFVGPGQLASSVYTLLSQTAAGNPFPSTWSGPDLVPNPSCPRKGTSEWCAQISLPVESESSYQATYTPPAPLPNNDTIQLSGQFVTLGWHHSEPSSSVECTNSMYTICTVANYNPVSQAYIQGHGVVPASAQLHLSNLPLIIKIKNRLPGEQNNSLTLDGQAEYGGNLMLDPAGGTPATIEAGQTGYFGGYLPVSTADSKASFTATYEVASNSTHLQGWSFTVSAVFNEDGSLDSSSTCTPHQGTGTSTLYCEMAFEGGTVPKPPPSGSSSPTPSPTPQSGMQRLTLSIHD